jgi:hypothetical protein
MYPSQMRAPWFTLSEIKPSDHTKSGDSNPVLVRINNKIFHGTAHFSSGVYHSMTIRGLANETPASLCCYGYDVREDEVEWTDNPTNSIIQARLPKVDTRREKDIPEGERFDI